MKPSALDLTALRAALTSLDEALSIVDDRAWLERQADKVRNTLVAGVVQNFEFVYEVGVKMLRRRLTLDAANPGEVAALNFRDLVRLGGQAGLVEDVRAWFNYREMRNLTAHTYDPAKARAIREGASALAKDARSLLDRLEAANG